MTKDNDLHLLEIVKATPDDQGTYVCKIENPVGSATADAELEVFGKISRSQVITLMK